MYLFVQATDNGMHMHAKIQSIKKWVWSSPLRRVVQEESNKIYFKIFKHSYKFLQILEV
jgi:hypothetical protein